jgi:hypothetical protein
VGAAVETCEETPSLLNPHSVWALRATPPQSSLPQYYNLKGEPLGTVKPSNSGIYIEKTGKTARKVLVK